MLRYAIARLLQGAATLAAIAVLTFALMHAVPGGPFEVRGGERASAALLQAQRAYYGVDRPVAEQFARWAGHVLRGDLGPSLARPGRAVGEVIADGAVPSAIVGLLAFLIAAGAGLPLGVIAAVRRGGADAAILALTTVLAAVPAFVIAFVVLLVGAVWLGWFEVRLGRNFTGIAMLPLAIPPAIALGAPALALIARLMRATMIEALASDYVRTARAKGLPARTVVLRHAARNAVLPVLTIAGPLLATLVAGSIVVESIFGLPGIGAAFVTALLQRDYAVIMGITLFYTATVLAANALVDLLYPVLDPRVGAP